MAHRLQDDEIPYRLRRALDLEIITWREAHGLVDFYQRLQQDETIVLPEWLAEANLKIFLLEYPPPVLLIM